LALALADTPTFLQILSDIEAYLNRPDIQQILGVDRDYKGCNTDVNIRFMMAGDWMRPYVTLVPELLDEGVKVLIYAGDADYIVSLHEYIDLLETCLSPPSFFL
jgi:cathepsin A (carboxypeptidase C)